ATRAPRFVRPSHAITPIIIDELLHTHPDENNYRVRYHERIVESILETASADDFIESLASLIKRLAVDHLHLVGDIFDRGGGAAKIMDRLLTYHSLDIQWGNHDLLWMGAAAGEPACIATVLRNNLRYDNYEILRTTTASRCVSLLPLPMPPTPPVSPSPR
ncbi:fructose-1,6-bisphosphatase, partial [human gut metagenome]